MSFFTDFDQWARWFAAPIARRWREFLLDIDEPASRSFGTSPDTVDLSSDGVYLSGDATMWEDLRVPALAARVPAVAGPDIGQALDDGAGSTGVFIYWYSPTTEEQQYFAVQIPHSYKEGSDIEVHVHWIPADTAPGAGTDVCWGLEYTWANMDSVFDDTTIIYGDVQTIGAGETLTLNKHYVTEIGDIDGGGITPNRKDISTKSGSRAGLLKGFCIDHIRRCLRED
jgi:hypothetical protein